MDRAVGFSFNFTDFQLQNNTDAYQTFTEKESSISNYMTLQESKQGASHEY